MKVKFVGFGGYLDTPCYEDENGKLYFDENHGRGNLNLYTGAYRDRECDEICGEPNRHVTENIECDEPYKVNPRARDYELLSRLQMDCKYFVNNGGGLRVTSLWAEPKEMLEKMEEILNSFNANEKPEWLTDDDFAKLKNEVLETEKRNPVKVR
jgi:hypothetical protein